MINDFKVVIIQGEGTIYGQKAVAKVFPWAEDCLRELRSSHSQIRRVLLSSMRCGDLEQLKSADLKSKKIRCW